MNLITDQNNQFLTVHVYSDNLMGKYDENSATRNSHPYAKYHLLREEILNNQFSSEFINLRLSNGVGVPVIEIMLVGHL